MIGLQSILCAHSSFLFTRTLSTSFSFLNVFCCVVCRWKIIICWWGGGMTSQQQQCPCTLRAFYRVSDLSAHHITMESIIKTYVFLFDFYTRRRYTPLCRASTADYHWFNIRSFVWSEPVHRIQTHPVSEGAYNSNLVIIAPNFIWFENFICYFFLIKTEFRQSAGAHGEIVSAQGEDVWFVAETRCGLRFVRGVQIRQPDEGEGV